MRIVSIIINLIIVVIVIVTFTTAQPTVIRCCHGSAIADDKLYVGGGVTGPVGGDIWTDDFFSLDLTKPFSTSPPEDIPYMVHAKVPVKSRTHTLVYAKNEKGGIINTGRVIFVSKKTTFFFRDGKGREIPDAPVSISFSTSFG